HSSSMPEPRLSTISTDHAFSITPPVLPAEHSSSITSQLLPGEPVLAWLETDLDDRLHFSSGMVVVTDTRLLATGSGAGWQSWSFREGMKLVRLDHAGIGTIELVDDSSLLA